ncbi:MAG TPA: GTP cyclohydrolase I FolE [Candidatus Sulfotelmatobacter sp.]|jgi:GTP cyclohydrolase I|nr:GTP cyclohydrolase I FolE [Candidatus Sulfotelmatobacter sp.]
MQNNTIEKLITQLLKELGEDPNREGLKKTPHRVTQMFKELTSGYTITRQDTIKDALFAEKVHNMIVLRDIELYSLCEHHLLPFFGKCHIGYIPKDNIIGVSKLARIVDRFAKRLQIQERLTQEIAQELQDALDPNGVGVIIEAQHLCMMMRGIEKQNSLMITSSVLGSFRSDQKTREEFFSIVNKS